MASRKDADTRRKIIYTLANAGLSAQSIAEMLKGDPTYGVIQGTVEKDLTTYYKFLDDIAPTDPLRARRMQLGRLEFLQRLALESFVESKILTATTTTEFVDEDGKPHGDSTRTTQKATAGDAKFLTIARDIEAERSKILGVYAPKEEKRSGELRVTFSWGDDAPMELPPGEIIDVDPSLISFDDDDDDE